MNVCFNKLKISNLLMNSYLDYIWIVCLWIHLPLIFLPKEIGLFDLNSTKFFYLFFSFTIIKVATLWTLFFRVLAAWTEMVLSTPLHLPPGERNDFLNSQVEEFSFRH